MPLLVNGYPYTMKFQCSGKAPGQCSTTAKPQTFKYVRPQYCPTTYFNGNHPDPHTYLQYWRRRMCYCNYLEYFGIPCN